MIVGHVMGIPVEESVLQLAPAGANVITAVAIAAPDLSSTAAGGASVA